MLDEETDGLFAQSITEEQRFINKLKTWAKALSAVVIYSAAFDVLLMIHRDTPNWVVLFEIWTILGLVSLIVVAALCINIARMNGEIKRDVADLARLRKDATGQ